MPAASRSGEDGADIDDEDPDTGRDNAAVTGATKAGTSTPNPGAAAVFELRKQYWRNNYSPVPVYTGQKRPRGNGWRADALRDPPLATQHPPKPEALSTGIATGAAVGADVDVRIQPVVDRLVYDITQRLGKTPLLRIGLAPKTLLVFRADQPFSKVSTGDFTMPDGTEAKVEILAEGQFFVADGIHPDTGKPYFWPNLSPDRVPLAQLPAISLQQAEAIVADAKALLIANGGVEKNPPKQPRQGNGKAAPTFFDRVNEAALHDLDGWVPEVFPTAVYQPGTGAWRVKSADRGRPDLEEDISLHPDGIRDFGLEKGLTPIDTVMEHGAAAGIADVETPVKAGHWLCERLGIDPATLGWDDRTVQRDGREFQPQDGDAGETKSEDDGSRSDAEEPAGPEPSASSPGDGIDTSILRLNRRRPPRFPVEIFGLEWAFWVDDTAAGAACPVDYVAAPLLATASALIGNARWAMAWPSWAEPPHLWLGSIGDSGDGKSPGARLLLHYVVAELERRMIGDFPDQLRMWKANVQIAQQRAKMWEREMAEALKKNDPLPPRPFDVDPEPEPQKPRLVMRDVTLEKVASVLAVAAPKGLLMVRSELAGWLLGMNQYNDGARSFWLEAWDGGPYSVDRKTSDTIYVARNVVAWSGGIQPERLAQLMAEPDDGLFARFLWCWPDPIAFQRSDTAPDVSFALEALDRLRMLELHRNDDGTLVPIFVPLEERAWPRLVAFANEMQQRKDLSAGLLRSSYGKTRGVPLRLALILEFLWWCGRAGIDPPPTAISDAALEQACMWVRDYAIPMAERTFVDATASQADRNVVTLAGWIVRQRPAEVHVRAMQREVRLPGLTEAAAIHAACGALVDARWLLPRGTAHGRDRNRAVYPVNPALWSALGPTANTL